jgi:hypothetical protein
MSRKRQERLGGINMKKYTRKEVMPLGKFVKGSMRTMDPGRPGHTKLVVARLKSGTHKGKTRVQAILKEMK